MSFSNRHPIFSLMAAILLSLALAFIAALAGAMIHYYRQNYVGELKIPEDSEQLVVKKQINVKL